MIWKNFLISNNNLENKHKSYNIYTNMNRKIKKVAVLGSGVMGSGIACHFANIGTEVLLIDIVPRELNDKEKAAGLSLDDKAVRSKV